MKKRIKYEVNELKKIYFASNISLKACLKIQHATKNGPKEYKYFKHLYISKTPPTEKITNY